MNHNNRLRTLRGFSLIELMVAMTIGLIVTASVGVIFINTKKSYSTQDTASRIQENGRFAMYYIMRDLRLTGYAGCLSDLEGYESTLNTPTDFNYNLDVAIEGMDRDGGATTWSPSGSNGLPASIKAGTDIVAIRLADPSTSVAISQDMPNASAELKVTSVSGIADGDIILLSDCATADMMQVTAVQSSSLHLQHNAGGSSSPGNATQKLQKSYGTDAKVYRFVTRRYYIRNNANGVPSLYRDENGANPTELVEGIEDLQVTYGVDTDNDKQPNRFVKAGHASLDSQAEWANVVAVRFALLARSPGTSDSHLDANTYELNDITVGPFNDRNQRRVFATTVLLRNLTRL